MNFNGIRPAVRHQGLTAAELRLWPWEGKDLLFGLVRVEVAPENGSTEQANTISRWIMADRAR